MIDPQLLGALYAVTAVLALLALVGLVTLLTAWAWLRGHERGHLAWHETGFELRADARKLPTNAQEM